MQSASEQVLPEGHPFDVSEQRSREHALHCFACGGLIGTVTCACREYDLPRNELANALAWTYSDGAGSASLPSPAPMVEQAGEVIQADRDLFVFLLGFDATDDMSRIDRGDFDTWPKMQAIARHRLNTRPAPADAGMLREAELSVVEAARDLVMEPGGLRNNGQALVVVEKADKSDPHYRLCTALGTLAALNSQAHQIREGDHG